MSHIFLFQSTYYSDFKLSITQKGDMKVLSTIMILHSFVLYLEDESRPPSKISFFLRKVIKLLLLLSKSCLTDYEIFSKKEIKIYSTKEGPE